MQRDGDLRIMAGSQRALDARDRIRDGTLAGPRLVVCSPQVTRSGGGSTPDSARAVVRRHASRGYDCLKIYTGPKPDAFAAAVATADSLGLPTAGHAPFRLPLALLLRLGSIEHIEEIQSFFGRRPQLSAAQDGARVDSIASSGVRVVPTIGGIDFRPYFTDTGYARLLEQPSTSYVSDFWFHHRDRELEARRASGQNIDSLMGVFGEYHERAVHYTGFFHDRGVRLIMGTDAGNILHVGGFAAVLELESLVRAGLTPAQALAAATTDAADFLNIEAGRIEVGRAADLVLLRRNPLENVGNVAEVEGVLAGSRWFDTSARRSILEALRRRPMQPCLAISANCE